MDPVLQSALPAFAWTDPRLSRLPGILPLDPGDWLIVDDAYAGQMALRDRLIARDERAVHALSDPAQAAAEELFAEVLARLPAMGFRLGRAEAQRPDGVRVPLDPSRPLLTLGRLVQEDFCLMQAAVAQGAGQETGQGGEHLLTGAILCFPASWTLDEKIGRPLTRIHAPVPPYDADVAARVQRLFDAIRDGRPLWRMNAHPYATPELFHPRREADPRPKPAGPAAYLRSERQCLLRLPKTQAVVFSIHTYMVAMASLPPEARARLPDMAPHYG